MGYNQLWFKGDYTASAPLRWALILMGTLGWQGSVKSWVHWKHGDASTSDRNSHAWMFEEEPNVTLLSEDASKRLEDQLVNLQHTLYPVIALFLGLVVPTLVAGVLWEDYLGGYLYGGLMSRLFIWHESLILNSILGSHEIRPLNFDTTKWAFGICEKLGVAHAVRDIIKGIQFLPSSSPKHFVTCAITI